MQASSRLTLIRHAQATTNTRPKLIGGYQPLAPLTDLWKNQAIALWHRLKNEKFILKQEGRIYSSPAVRTTDTTTIVCGILGLPPKSIAIDERLRELGQGEWENKPRNTVYTPVLKTTIDASQGTYRSSGGESQIDVGDRMLSWVETVKNTPHTIVFSHGMAIKCLVQRLLDLPPGTAHHHELWNTGITELEYTGEYWRLLRFNDHSHINWLI